MSEPRLEKLNHHPPGYQDALDFLYGRIDYERATDRRNNHHFRLSRTQQLFQQLGLGGYLFRHGGNPEDGSTNAQPSQAQPSQAPPSPKVPLIHIAGTKGKGSTATMVSAILTAAGYRVGLYTSPHLTDLEERFRIDGEPCSREDLLELISIVAPVVKSFDAMELHTSFFELTTAMAILHFDRNDCDAIVLEVGLGGRLDSTNVCASTVAAITSIGLDHQRVLGNTIAEITREKAGIIKGGVPVVSGVTSPEAIAVIRKTAAGADSPIYERGLAFDVGDWRLESIGSRFVYNAHAPELRSDQNVGDGDLDDSTHRSGETPLPLFLPLCGEHQVHNAAVAISITRLLTAPGRIHPLVVSDEQIAAGLANVKCVGRMERFLLLKPPLQIRSDKFRPVQIILDTAHNADSIKALCDSVQRCVAKSALVENVGCKDADSNPYQGTSSEEKVGVYRHPIVVVIGASRDKDLSSMAVELFRIADEIICTRYTSNPRWVDENQLAETFASVPVQFNRTAIRSESNPENAFAEAIGAAADGGTVIICGSFFLAGELRPKLLAIPNLHRLTEAAAGPLEPDRNSSLGKITPVQSHFSGTGVEA
ncbi:MAG: bifunctional folylpolyglutamate synthase/dihydrofolate synthase [Planctomycetales bacterium]|nr:bifunctional folylpolyglutamate synthase/dihydrofolate synthase [Planctomycetales bacterium]